MAGKIFLIPNSLGSQQPDTFLPESLRKLITGLRYLVVENTRNARRYLKTLDRGIPIDAVTFMELNKHTDPGQVKLYLQPALEGHDMGILSEAGLPGIADPGAQLVGLAHRQNITVVPLTGPSSVFLALMASGFNGQAFRFNGYLPIQRKTRMEAIRQLEKRVTNHNETQIFIETPYRNNALLEDICRSCDEKTFLCIAADLTTENEMIRTTTIDSWKKKKTDLHKRPAVFLLGSPDVG